MGAEAEDEQHEVRRPRAARRPRSSEPRDRKLDLAFTEKEYETLAEAAARKGVALRAFVALAARAVAEDAIVPGRSPLQDALVELMQARIAVRKIETALEEVTARNEGGTESQTLRVAVAAAGNAVSRVEQAAEAVRRRLL